MSKVLTLVGKAPLPENLVSHVTTALGSPEPRWLAARALDLMVADDTDPAGLIPQGAEIDYALQTIDTRRKKLLIADMDSTIIEEECLDELADRAGIGAEIAAITERAMRGELDFEGALDARVARLKGLASATIEEVIETRLHLSDGARTLVQTMGRAGAHCLLVSGGFAPFVEAIAARCGFSGWHANRLEIAEGALTGNVIRPILGREAKAEILNAAMADKGIPASLTLAVGDGANDLAMLACAGLGVAYRAKPAVAEAAHARIDHTDLKSLLFFQGIAERDFADDD